MGIPRLTQDLSSHAQDAVLGSGKVDASIIRIQHVVLDGPSLVFHVYHKVLSHTLSQKQPQLNALPTYSDINRSVQQFLLDLISFGVSIEHIYFDGALPLSKYTTRLGRLEKSREYLELYRRQNPDVAGFDPQTVPIDYSSVLWHSYPSRPVQQSLPVPPFLVPSAIEYLKQIKWNTKLTVVPGEADPFCAIMAQQIKASVISNDSDLVLYELGEDSYVVPFHSLELSYDAAIPPSSTLKAICYQPWRVAQQMSLCSLLSFGYERLRDFSASKAIIAQRAKLLELQEEKSLEWQEFVAEFTSSADSESRDKILGLDNFDPRLAEVVVSLITRGQKLYSYLPILIEDHDRDSSWLYGRRYRRLAYSILAHFITQPKQKAVVEYSRKGARISSDLVHIFNDADFEIRLSEMINLLRQPVQIYVRDVENHSSKDMDKTRIISNFYVYMLVALRAVVFGKFSFGKTLDIHSIHRLLLPEYFTNNKRRFHLTWNDFHLFANIQAVLYSLRMVWQVVRWITARDPFIEMHPPSDPDLGLSRAKYPIVGHIQVLGDVLHTMPPLEVLAMSIGEFQIFKNNLPKDWMRQRVEEFLEPLRSEFGLDLIPPVWRESKIHRSLFQEAQPNHQNVRTGEDAEKWQTSSKKRASKDDKAIAHTSTPPAKRKPGNERVSSSRNMFDLLQEMNE